MTETAVQPDLDSRIDRKYFLPYQVDDIVSDHRLEIEEKSIRVGVTFGRAMRAVRRRMMGKGNYLHTSVNERIGKSFIGDCRKFCQLYDVVGASEVREFDVWNKAENRSETAYEIEFKKQGCSIKVFSSNPDSLRGEGGEVGIDELTSHKQPEELVKAAGGRAMWGFPVAVWTSHKGVNSAFNRMIKAERAKGARETRFDPETKRYVQTGPAQPESRWHIKRITLLDALEMGLLEKINQVSGQHMTREEFLADTKAMVGGQDAFDEECMCDPKAEGSQAIKWGYIDAAKRPYPLLRKHIEGNESFDAERWIAELIDILRHADRVALGYDVARTGHLSAVPIIARFGEPWKLMSLLTMHKRKFTLQRDAVAAIMRAVPALVGAGDATGLGMQTCEDLVELFGPYRFTGVNFGTMKPEIGTKLVKVFEDGRFHLSDARKDEDIQYDLAALQTITLSSGRATFTESPNPINKLSHCDIAWSIGLSVLVGEDNKGEQRFF